VPTFPNVLLRPVTEDDLPALFLIQREPEGYEMAAVPSRDEAEFYRHWRENVLAKEDVTIRAILFDGEVVGDVGSFILEGRRAVGYWIGKKYWGRGIATAAVAQFVSAHDKRRPLSAYVAVQNVASYRVLQKCGFQQVGNSARASDGVEEYRMELC
jgi:RimJ/RimL family protein N-acetyltransferase